MSNTDLFKEKRKHLEKMSDEDLTVYFWVLTNKIVDPLINLAKTYTTPSIERSILLRMGFASFETDGIVKNCIKYGLIGKGAGHVVYLFAKRNDISVREAGLKLLQEDNWKEVIKLFEGDKRNETRT